MVAVVPPNDNAKREWSIWPARHDPSSPRVDLYFFRLLPTKGIEDSSMDRSEPASSRSPLSDDDDFDEGDDEEDEAYEDDEGTLDEEEALDKEDVGGDDELRLLSEEGELSIEELRRRYAMPHAGGAEGGSSLAEEAGNVACSSTKLTATYFVGTGEYGDEEEGEDDVEYMPSELWKKPVRIGSEYQVDSLPDPMGQPSAANGTADSSVTPTSTTADRERTIHAETMWVYSPNKCPLRKVEKYLAECEKIRWESPPSGTSYPLAAYYNPTSAQPAQQPPPEIADDENALLALLKADYDVESAKKGAPFHWVSLQSVNGARLTYKEPWRGWDTAECEKFEDALLTYGKNFFAIKENKLTERSVGELVRFYYSWKKTERFDVYSERKRKLIQQMQEVNKASTDIMGNIMADLLYSESSSGGAITTIEQQQQQQQRTIAAASGNRSVADREKWLGVGPKHEAPRHPHNE